jgi:hypothetical protein
VSWCHQVVERVTLVREVLGVDHLDALIDAVLRHVAATSASLIMLTRRSSRATGTPSNAILLHQLEHIDDVGISVNARGLASR